MPPTHFLPPNHFSVYLKQFSHPEDGGSKFLQNDEHLTITQKRKTRKTIISPMQIFWPSIACCTSISLSTILTTAHNMIHALTMFTTKPTLQSMQWHTHFGNVTTPLHLILHPGKWLEVRSHICNNRLLIWTGLVHIWNRRLQDSLLLCDITIMGALLILCLLYQNMS